MKNKKIFTIILLFFIIEYAPFNIKTKKNPYLKDNSKLKAYCSPSKVLLEYPINRYINSSNKAYYLIENLFYTFDHSCLLVNGYSGFFPPSLDEIETKIFQFVQENKAIDLKKFLLEKNINIIRINKKQSLNNFLEIYNKFDKKDFQIIDSSQNFDLIIINQ